MRDWSKKRAIMKRYDTTAEIYDTRYAEEQKRKIEAALRHLKVKKESLVLDVGCGTGMLFSYLAGKVEMLVGVDVSIKTLRHAAQNRMNSPDVQLILGDADNLPLRSGAFDQVFSFTLLQNMPKPVRTLKEIRRVAKSAAIVTATGMKKAFSRDNFEDLLKEAGLKITALEEASLQCYVAVSKLTKAKS